MLWSHLDQYVSGFYFVHILCLASILISVNYTRVYDQLAIAFTIQSMYGIIYACT